MQNRAQTEELLKAAAEAMAHAYAPYSHFHVGAALRSASGQIYSGCNVENAVFPIGSCAETNAIAAAVRAEGDNFSIAAISIVARDAKGAMAPVAPCGACRQAILEFGAEADVIFTDSTGRHQTRNIQSLLPDAFRLTAR